jgi:hypothetical protein
MATTNVTPAPADLHQQLVAEYAALAHKHVTVSFTLIGVLVLVLGLGAFGAFLGLRSYEAQLSKAEARELQYNADRKSWQDTLAQHDAQRAADAQQEAQVIAQIAARAKQAPPPVIQVALSPTATAAEEATGLAQAYASQIEPVVTPDSRLSISQPEAKLIISNKLTGDKALADLVDETKLYNLEVDQNTTLKADLADAKAENVEAQKVIQAYKKAAVKSKWRKILDGMKTVGMVAAAAAIGHAI